MRAVFTTNGARTSGAKRPQVTRDQKKKPSRIGSRSPSRASPASPAEPRATRPSATAAKAARRSTRNAKASVARTRRPHGSDVETRYQCPRFIAHTTAPKSSAPRRSPQPSQMGPMPGRETKGSTLVRERRRTKDMKTETKRRSFERARERAERRRAQSVAAAAVRMAAMSRDRGASANERARPPPAAPPAAAAPGSLPLLRRNPPFPETSHANERHAEAIPPCNAKNPPERSFEDERRVHAASPAASCSSTSARTSATTRAV